MLPLKLVRSFVFGETINNPLLLTLNSQHHYDDNDDDDDDQNDVVKNAKSRTPFLLFLPTKELVADTYRLATIARDMGMDLHPTPSLSHIILSYPSSSLSSPSSFPPSWSSSSLSSSSSSSSLPENTVPFPFPSLDTASLSHLRSFVKLSRGLFKLVFMSSSNCTTSESSVGNGSNWNCCSMSLFSRLTGNRIETMEGFCQSMAGNGWTLFKTKDNPSMSSSNWRISGVKTKSVYLFRKVYANRVRVGWRNNGGNVTSGESRIRELRLPQLDFRNAPLRILQYILLMTDDIFYLA